MKRKADSTVLSGALPVSPEEKNIFLEKMIGLISHDILVPLQYISKTADRLSNMNEGISAATRRDTIEEISITSACLAEMVQTMLQWTKAGEKIQLTEFNLPEALEPVITLHRKILASHNTILELQIDPELTVCYDPVLLRIIIHNLVMNAAKFTSGGKVRVHCASLPEGMLIEVADTGTGMPSAIIEQIIECGKAPSAPGIRGEKGQGMGYSIISQLVHDSNGSIEIASSAVNGTRVRVLIGKSIH